MRHVCVFPAGAQHDGMLKGSMQRSNRRTNIIAATSRAEEGKRQDLHSSRWANAPPRPGQNHGLGRLNLVQDSVFIHSSPFTKCHLLRLAAVRFKATERILAALFLELFAMPLSARVQEVQEHCRTRGLSVNGDKVFDRLWSTCTQLCLY